MADTCPYMMPSGNPCGLNAFNGLCVFHSHSTSKAGTTGVELAKRVSSLLTNTSINRIDFSGYRIPCYQFSDLVIDKELSLENAQLDDVQFLRCTFAKDVDFSMCNFGGKLTQFVDCEFKGSRTSFLASNFSALKTSFIKCTFQGRTIFNKAVFEEAAIFEGSRDSQSKSVFDGEVAFKYVIIRKPRDFAFRHVKFDRVELRGTDLSELKFVAVHWPKTKSSFTRRESIILYDQLKLEDESTDDKSPEFNLLQTAYRELKQNFDNNRFFGPADEFYFREMEMLRCYPKNNRVRYRSFRFLYRWCAGYGLYWFNSLLSLACTIIIFSGIILFTGLDKPKIDYELSWSLPSPSRLFFGYVDVLKYNLLSTFPSKEMSALYSPSIATRLVQVPEFILVATFTTLTVLAIRRRFKR